MHGVELCGFEAGDQFEGLGGGDVHLLEDVLDHGLGEVSLVC